MDHACRQEPAIHTIGRKIDVLDKKLDKYLIKTTRIEAVIGICKACFLVIFCPVLVGVVLYLINK